MHEVIIERMLSGPKKQNVMTLKNELPSGYFLTVNNLHLFRMRIVNAVQSVKVSDKE
jgi:hypothetical protein